MDGALKVLVLVALVLLVYAEASDQYESFPDIYRKHIDKALKKANSDFGRGHHVAFHSLRSTPVTTESNLNVNVLLQVTTCKKTSVNAYEHRPECNTRKAQTPWIDCLVCKTSDDQELVDCGTQNNVMTGQRKEIRKNCRTYRHGGSGLLSVAQ